MTDALVYTVPHMAPAPYITAPVQPHATNAVATALFTLKAFDEQQEEFVLHWLKREFCKRGGPRNLDYCMRVFSPEIFIQIYMSLKASSFQEAERAMSISEVVIENVQS